MTAQGNRRRQQAPHPATGRPGAACPRSAHPGPGKRAQLAMERRRRARRRARLRLAGWLAATAAAAGLIAQVKAHL